MPAHRAPACASGTEVEMLPLRQSLPRRYDDGREEGCHLEGRAHPNEWLVAAAGLESSLRHLSVLCIERRCLGFGQNPVANHSLTKMSPAGHCR